MNFERVEIETHPNRNTFEHFLLFPTTTIIKIKVYFITKQFRSINVNKVELAWAFVVKRSASLLSVYGNVTVVKCCSSMINIAVCKHYSKGGSINNLSVSSIIIPQTNIEVLIILDCLVPCGWSSCSFSHTLLFLEV